MQNLAQSIAELRAAIEGIGAIERADPSAHSPSGANEAWPDASKVDVAAADENGYTALMKAVKNGAKADYIEALIAAGSDVNARDKQGFTALIHAALQSETPDVVKTLVDAGADVNARDTFGRRAIDCLEERKGKGAFYGSKEYWEIRQLLY